jgi:phosphinothricin acetyltransferase
VIRTATGADAAAIAAIYNLYVRETIVTFEEDAVTIEEMAERIAEVAAHRLPWLVYEEMGELLGYAYASKWKGRCAYRFSVESTVYLAPEAQGRGIGTQLYAALFAQLKERGIHAVIGGIALPNPASVALHEKLGMRPIGQFREVGYKFGKWIDVGYWQATLE